MYILKDFPQIASLVITVLAAVFTVITAIRVKGILRIILIIFLVVLFALGLIASVIQPCKDTEAPVFSLLEHSVPICSPGGATVELTWSVTDDCTHDVQLVYRWKLASPNADIDHEWTTWTHKRKTAEDGLSNGSYAFYIEARDRTGKTTQEICDFEVHCPEPPDIEPPELVLNCGAPFCQPTGADVTFSWLATDNVTSASELEYHFKLDEDSWSAWSTETSTSYSRLQHGDHSFCLQAKDCAGNTAAKTCSFTVPCPPFERPADTTSPNITLYCGTPSYQRNRAVVNVSWEATDNVTPNSEIKYRFKMDEDSWSAWSSRTSMSYSDLLDRNYIFYVQAKDATGNVAEKSCSFTVSYPPPSSTLGLGTTVAGESAGFCLNFIGNMGDGVAGRLAINYFPIEWAEFSCLKVDGSILVGLTPHVFSLFVGLGPGGYWLPDDSFFAWMISGLVGLSLPLGHDRNLLSQLEYAVGFYTLDDEASSFPLVTISIGVFFGL